MRSFSWLRNKSPRCCDNKFGQGSVTIAFKKMITKQHNPHDDDDATPVNYKGC